MVGGVFFESTKNLVHDLEICEFVRGVWNYIFPEFHFYYVSSQGCSVRVTVEEFLFEASLHVRVCCYYHLSGQTSGLGLTSAKQEFLLHLQKGLFVACGVRGVLCVLWDGRNAKLFRVLEIFSSDVWFLIRFHVSLGLQFRSYFVIL